jgi:hypothetical protein
MWKTHALVRWTNQVTRDDWERVTTVLDVDDAETIADLHLRARSAAHLLPDTPGPFTIELEFSREANDS